MTKEILIVGGAGYIGSHMVRNLEDNGIKPVVLDNLVSGYKGAVGDAELIVADIGNRELLNNLFKTRKFGGVMHFASFIQVGESVTSPAKYYENNVARTITLLNAMVENNVQNFIFSSTAAIFGNPVSALIDEQHPKNPINPYGRSKLMIEEILLDYHNAYNLRFGCLRYFNAAGAIPDGTIGERHEPETHLIPLVLQAASGRRPVITVFGDDYETPDGTCIRDYIHVCDLTDAHLLLWQKLQGGMPKAHFNLGTGQGCSIMEVIKTSEHVTGRKINYINATRRSGDPASLVADGRAARKTLGWQPKFSDLPTIINDAWQWEQKLSIKLAA